MKKQSNSNRSIATFFLLIFFPSIFPVNYLYASNNGPNAPEAQSFESVNSTDMVNLSSGDMSYVLPLMEVDGFPVTLSYHGGVPLDLESTWTGLGWNINTGAINRSLNGTPDDWKGGNSLDFISYSESETITDITVGIGIANVAEVGVGASLSSNKGLSGSVFASVSIGDHAGANASIDTNGNYSLGVGVKTNNGSGGTNFGGGLSISGNVSGGGISAGVGAGVRTSNGLTVGMGASLDGSSMGASLGYSNGLKGGSAAAGSAKFSVSSFSQGDWDVESSGWFVPVQLGPISLGFGQRKVTQKLRKAFQKAGYGILYSNNNNTNSDAVEVEAVDGVFSDYQNRYRYGDAYDQSLPQPEKEFIGDYDLEREKINFTFANYDSYDVNASGISGAMSPKIFENATLMGIGYNNKNPNHSTNKMGIYYHNSKTPNKFLGNSGSNNINFYFNGQYANSKIIPNLLPLLHSSSYNTLANNLSAGFPINSERLRQGNFVEVFTNKQIRDGVFGFIDPVGLPKSQRVGTTYKDEGIGGYRITAPDGKVYHFSQPVYHYEMVDRSILKDTSEKHLSEKRQYTPFATHWLLTAITGPDYYNTSAGTRNYPSTGDYGYWIRLDHGKWSDGYVWRNPADSKLLNYSSTIDSKIGKDDFGSYQFGRKQIYYLDKIVSSTQTAYFVKDLRFDSAGSDLNYKTVLTTPIDNGGTGSGYVTVNENFTYKRQMQLKLSKIVLVNNQDATISTGNPSDVLKLNTFGLPNYVKTTSLTLNGGGGFYQEYVGSGSTTYNISINQEHNVIDVKDFQNFDYNKAIKVVDFNYNYNLGVKNHTNNIQNPTPGLSTGSQASIHHVQENPNVGKLTLKSITFKGRNNFDYMPPYQFEYKGEFISGSLPYTEYPPNALQQRVEYNNDFGFNYINASYNDIKAKDEWGYLKSDPTAWTLTKIKTPTGASINFEHEEDDYYTEAFSRMYWMDYLKFKVTNYTNYLEVEVQNQNGLNQAYYTKFSDYFEKDEKVFLDLWLCKIIDENCLVSSYTDRGKIDISSQNDCMVIDVSDSFLKIKVDKIPNVTLTGNDPGRALNTFYAKGGPNCGSNWYDEKPRGDCPEPNGGCGAGTMRDHSMNYKLLANKVPEDETGGGLRVKSITLKDENSNSYKTNYYYNNPQTLSKVKNVGDYKSSGITSYSPVRGLKYVPYQSELPSPGVMYEYVTMVAENSGGKKLGETRYRFHVLKPVFNIFDEDISMKDDLGREIFKATVFDFNASNGYFNQSKKLKAKNIHIKVNTSLIGQFRSVEEFNAVGQLMSKTEKHYLTGEELYNLPNNEIVNRGMVKESFQSMKSIFDTNENGNNPTLRERQLSLSSKTEYQSVLRSISTTTTHGIQTETFRDTDPNTGTFNTVETKTTDGYTKRVQKVPAYTKYSAYGGLGSKVDNINNKNMLVQEAMSITSVLKNNVWKTTQATIDTWNDTWQYRNEDNGTDAFDNLYKVWRKHKTFIWDEGLDADGAYLTSLKAANPGVSAVDYFNWSTGVPTSNKWKKASEVTRYTRFSLPIELKDINGNFMSSKMGDKDSKTLISGNARYTEMYYSGAEYVKQSNSFDGEVKGASFRTNEVAHTGNYSVKALTINDKVFEVTGTSGANNYYTSTSPYSQTFRPGKYKISFWAYKSYHVNSNGGQQTNALPAPSNQNHGQLIFNGNEIAVSETIGAGCWQQLNFYIDILPNTTNSISVRSRAITGRDYFDDFRMHPVASSVNSYVYDQNTDELAYSLDGNNMATAFKYDLAGRLVANYIELMDTPALVGGFKITNKYKQNYKDISVGNDALSGTIDNCTQNQVQPLIASVRNDCVGSTNSKFTTHVTGGSGDFKYEYKWLTNVELGIFTEYSISTATILLPYAPHFCNSNEFNKLWQLEVKVTDNVTGLIAVDSYNLETGNCNFESGRNWATMALANCRERSLEDISLILHIKDIGIRSNLKYEISYFDKRTQKFEIWNDLRNTNGYFSPESMQVVSNNCGSGYREFIYVAFRITDRDTGERSPINTATFYGECISSPDHITNLYPAFPDDDRYTAPGMAIFKDEYGKIIEIIDTNNPVR